MNKSSNLQKKRLKTDRTFIVGALATMVFVSCLPNQLYGQMIRTGLPFTTTSSSFYERIGIDFGFHLRGTPVNNIGDRTRGVFGLGPGGQLQPNLVFSQGSVNSAVPAFGGYDPNADATFGYGVRNGSGGYNLGFRLGKGSSRSISNTTPVLMTRNGFNGSIFNGTATPFVTGVIPVVGNGGYALPNLGNVKYVSPLEMKLRQLHMDRANGGAGGAYSSQTKSDPYANLPERSFGNSNSTANQGDLSVKEIKRQRKLEMQRLDAEKDSKAAEYVAKSNDALSKGHDGAARSYLRAAIRYASENQKHELQKKLDKLIMDN